jgi:hypothetical protein
MADCVTLTAITKVSALMFGSRRDKATEGSRRQWSQDLLKTAHIDARLPNRPSLDGYKVEEIPFGSVVQLFRTQSKHGDHTMQSHRTNLRVSESAPGKALTPE